MYVFCVGMYRSGSTWQYDVVSRLLESHRGGRRLGFVTGEEFAHLPGVADSWQILKAHDQHPAFAVALADGRALAVYSFRDVRDVAYSLLHKLRGSFEDIVEREQFLHLVLANDAFWAARPRTLCQRYEDLMARPAAAVGQLAAHLGVALAPNEAQTVAEEFSLKANLWRTIELANRLRDEGVDLEDPTNALHWDGETLLHWDHIREGRVGGWRTEATPREVAVLAGLCGAWLVARGYEPDTGWALPALDHFRRELAAAQHALGAARAELTRRTQQLDEVKQLGPVALGLARCVHDLSVRYPRLSATLKRLLGPLAR